MKQITMGLASIESLAQRMIDDKQCNADRAIAFAAIRVIADKLTEINEDLNNGNAYTDEKITEIICHSQSIAHLDDGNGHPDVQHMSWLMRAINSVKSNIALGPYIDE